jgi:hypothetical protein
MGVFNSVMLGKVRGSVGNVTMQNWRGLNTVRSKPVDVANPNTTDQQNQRGKFALLVNASRVLSSPFSIGLAKQAIKKTAYNVFVQLNSAVDLITGSFSGFTFEKDRLILAKGSAPALLGVECGINGSTAEVEFTGVSGSEPPVNSPLYAAIVRANPDGTCSLLGFASASFDEYAVNVVCSSAPNPLSDRAIVFYVDSSSLQPCDSVNVAVTA